MGRRFDSSVVSSFPVSRLKSFTNLKLMFLKPMFSMSFIAVMKGEFASCFSVHFLSMWKPMSMSRDPMYFLPLVFSKFLLTMW